MKIDDEMKELIVRIDERLKALNQKLDDFIESVAHNYQKKSDFEKWSSEEFIPIKERVNEIWNLRWLIISTVAGTLLLSLFKLVIK